MAEDSQSLSRPDKVSQRPRPHFLHDVTAMNFDTQVRLDADCAKIPLPSRKLERSNPQTQSASRWTDETMDHRQ